MHVKHLVPGVRSRRMTFLLSLMAALTVVCVIIYPDKAFQASLDGLTVWWKFVFPALLPFWILSELMIGLGVAHGLGVLLEPLMRLAFRLPGTGALAAAMSFTAGIPAGAKVTADLRKQNAVTRLEGERLLALSHMCSPIFLLAVVGAGFLGSARAGLEIAIFHYVSALTAGIVMRFLHKHAEDTDAAAPPPAAGTRGFARLLDSVAEAQAKDGRTFGKLLGDSVISSVQNLMMIGGYMMMFSVLVNILNLTYLAPLLTDGLQRLLSLANLPGQLAQALVPGLLEIHLGSYASSQADMPPQWGAALIGGVLGWSGLSVLFQVNSLIHSTDLRIGAYIQGRLLHGGLAFVLTWFLWNRRGGPLVFPPGGRRSEAGPGRSRHIPVRSPDRRHRPHGRGFTGPAPLV